MLVSLSVRDVVLIKKLDLSFLPTDPIKSLKKLISFSKIQRNLNAPPFPILVGYLGYPMIKYMEKIELKNYDTLKIPEALLAGTLVASGFLQITEIASYKLPENIIDYCLLILGASVGCRFADKTFKEVAKNTVHSFVATLLLVLLGLAAAIVAGYVIDKNFFTLLLSYCPGGIYEVAVIAIFFDLDPEFVSFHHIIRLLMILFVVPLILKFIYKNKKPT